MILEEIRALLKQEEAAASVIDGRLLGVCPFPPLAASLLECRGKGRLPAEAASVLMALFPYGTALKKGNLSRYAMVPDYHLVAGKALEALSERLKKQFPAFQFVPFCDNSPIPEVYAAALCGLGVQGENGLLIHPQYGSWVFIGEIVTDCPLPPTGSGKIQSCLQCGRCRGSCPGGALSEKGFYKENCISHITQKKGTLTLREQSLIQKGKLAWGCDICQECCPMNRNTKNTWIKEFSTGAQANVEKGGAERGSDRAYAWRGPDVIKRNLQLLREDEANGRKGN